MRNALSFAGPWPLKVILADVVGCHPVWRAAPDSFDSRRELAIEVRLHLRERPSDEEADAVSNASRH